MSEVLLIDAEQPFAQQLVDALKGTGFSVKQLEDGKEGLEYARANKPALIVLCVELPKMSGYSICNKLKKDGELKTIPLIITSSEATPETFAQHKKLKTRAEDYLIKPFDPPSLLEKIGALIEVPEPADAAAPPAPPEDELASFEALDDLGEDLGGDLGNELGSDDILDAGEVELGDDELDELSVASDDDIEEADALAGLGDDFEGLEEVSADSELSDVDLLGDLGGSDDDMLAGLGDDLELDSSGDEADLGSLDADSQNNNDLGDDGLGGDDDLNLGGAVNADNALDDFDDAFENMAPLGEASPKDVPSVQAAASLDDNATSGADFAQLSSLRRENSDLKARVSELETRLGTAEKAAEASKSQLNQSKSSSSTSARDVLNLKEQLMSKEKEVMALKDEMFEKEKAGVDIQEEVENIRTELDAKTTAVQDKEAELASATTRLASVSQERDDLEKQVNDHLGKAQADAERLRGELAGRDAALEALKTEMESKAQDIAAATQTAEEAEDRLVAAYKRLEAEESVRAKAKEATQIALALLAGDVDPNGEMAAQQADA